MTCYHPLIRIEHHQRPYKTAKGKLAYKSTIERADDVLGRLEELRSTPNTKAQIIPCGNCIGCRLEYSREWANRGYLEAKLYKENYFVTLTYKDEELPKNEEITTKNGITYTDQDGSWKKGTLEPRHFTKFMHDLRQYMQRNYNANGIRFMGCGEYGDEGERPHYHIILLNCPLPAETFYKPRLKEGHFYYQNTIIEKCWTYGISNITECSWNTIAYTARYVTKKITGKESDDNYAMKGQNKEFFRMSRMPGIGKPYYDLYKDKIYKHDKITIKNEAGIVSSKPPKYFDALYEKEEPKKFKEIQRKRQKQKRNQDKITDELTSYTRLEHLKIKERSKEDKTKKLIREYEKKKKK